MSANNFGLQDPTSVNLDSTDPDLMRQVVCYLTIGGNEYNGNLGVRISAVFVIWAISTFVTFFPVAAARVPKLRIPLYVYLFARYFGAGVIVATAFIHLLEPAFEEIGFNTCVGLTGGWASYTWPPAFALVSAMLTFLMEFSAERYVEKKYGIAHTDEYDPTRSQSVAATHYEMGRRRSTHQGLHSADQDGQDLRAAAVGRTAEPKELESNSQGDESDADVAKREHLVDVAFRQQITAFLILEFGVLFHSVIIGLALGTAGDEFGTLYVVLVFHQSFEGLGIGARLSAIPFPKKLSWMPWVLCAAYGLATPLAVAGALGVRTTYNPGSITANIVSGVLDSLSAGILMYTGFVELIARDFLFNPDRTNDDKQLAWMMFCLFLGAGIMALLGKWA